MLPHAENDTRKDGDDDGEADDYSAGIAGDISDIPRDCWNLLVHKRRFREAVKPNPENPNDAFSVISFASWSDEEFAAFRPVLLRSITQHPEAFVHGETRFLTNSGGTDEAPDFLKAAGFSDTDIARILRDECNTPVPLSVAAPVKPKTRRARTPRAAWAA